MPIYVCQFSVLGRAKSGSAVRSASYRSGERLQERGRTLGDALEAASYRSGQDLEDGTGKVYSYRREDVVHSEIMLPVGAHPALADRGTLWREVEAVERRADAQLARCCTLSLPRELGRDERLELARDFVAGAFVARGMVADLCIHEKQAGDGGLNAHAHVMLTMRAIDPATGGFGKKERGWNAKAMLTGWRREWEHACNAALERAAVQERVSCDRLEVQLGRALEAGEFEAAAKLDRLPGVHLGPAAAAMERQGLATDLGDELRAVAEENAARAAAYEAVREMAADVPEAPAKFLEARATSADPLDAFQEWAGWARETLEHLRELARDGVERVQEIALSAWDRMVAAMSPMSDHAIAEREAAQEREAELDRAIDEVLAEMDLPEPHMAHEDREREPAAEVEPPELGDDDWLDVVLDEMDREDAWDRGHERERGMEHEM